MRIPITAVDVRPLIPPSGRVMAYVSIEVGGWIAIHDIRIIRGNKGFIVAFPSRKMMDRCSGCGVRNPYLNQWCGDCGRRLDPNRSLPRDAYGRTKLYADILHPINEETRLDVEMVVMRAYREAMSGHCRTNGVVMVPPK